MVWPAHCGAVSGTAIRFIEPPSFCRRSNREDYRSGAAGEPGIPGFARSAQTRPLRSFEIYPEDPNYLGTQHFYGMPQQADWAYQPPLQSFYYESGAPVTTEYGNKCTGTAVGWQVL